MLNENFVILGSLVFVVGGFSYFVDTLRGKIQPNKVSWLLWSLAPTIVFFAQISQHVGLQSLLAFTMGFVPFLVFIASFVNKKSFWKLEKFDFICGFLSLLGLLLWLITKMGNIAILFGIFSDFIASLPTFVKVYKNPETENDHVFFANSFSALITIFTIKNWNFETSAFPVYAFLMMGLIALFIRFKLGKIFK